MKTKFKKVLSVILAVVMLTSLLAVVGSAASKYAAPDIITVSSRDALANLDKDIPIVEVLGFGEPIYKGLLAYEEEDYEQIWAPSATTIALAVAKNSVQLSAAMIKQDYDALGTVLCDIILPIFGEAACDENGVPNPNTGVKKSTQEVKPVEAYGYENCFTFGYDWRLDMHTLSEQLDVFINKVMEVTGSDKVALAGFSMGTCVLSTYLYEHYYTNPDYNGYISSVIYIAGALNGVAACGDPFSGNISLDGKSLTRFLSEMMIGNDILEVVYYVLDLLYSAGTIDNITDFANKVVDNTMDKLVDNGMLKTMGTIPGFYALMSTAEYEACKEYLFSDPANAEKFAGLIAKCDYYHYEVQATNADVVEKLFEDDIHVGILAEYGFSMAPCTSDNDRMSDSVITTAAESFGATCAEVDGTLGDDYVQAVACPCGKNHISPDNQIDASTGKFADVTWFLKGATHNDYDRYFAELIDLIVYSDEQINVFTYEEFPQYRIADGEGAVPMTADNAGVVENFDDTTVVGRIKAFIEKIIAFFENFINMF